MSVEQNNVNKSHNYLISIVGLLFLLGSAWQQGVFVKIQHWLQARPYEQQITACVQEKTAQAAGTQIIGLDYECAIQIGKSIQNSQPDAALQLCMDHRPFAMDDNTQKMACRSSLRTPTALPTPTPTSKPADMMTYQNTKYGYQFMYPKKYHIDMTDQVAINQSPHIFLYDDNKLLFEIDALDPELLRHEKGWEETIALWEGPLDTYVQFIQGKNQANNYLQPSSTTMIDGYKAHELWLKNAFNDGASEKMIEHPQATFFVKPHTTLFEVSFPLGSPPSSDIFATLKFNQ